jgi:hypothetical protein
MKKKYRNSKNALSEQKAINILKTDSEEAAYRRAKEDEFNPLNLLKGILGFVFVVAIAFGWMMLMLLIISFVSLSYLHFNIDVMLYVSAFFAVVCGVIYIFSKIRKSIGRRKL